MSRLLGSPVPLAPTMLRCGSRVTHPWRRDGFEGYAAPMPGHLIGAYHSSTQCAWKLEAQRFAGELRPGTITLIPDQHDGYWRLDGPIVVAHVYLTAGRLQQCADIVLGPHRVELVPRVGTEDVAVTRLVHMITEEACDPASSLFVEQAIDLLCLRLAIAHSATPRRLPIPRRGLARWQVEKVTRYLGKHLGTTIELDELAALVGLSRFHFCTAFRLATGETPHAALTRLRVARARELLADPDRSVADVAFAVGYQTQSAFGAVFRRHTGVTPSAYRRRS
ncbi:MAG: AraC family transcriptional regulator [Kofleriaceae bacterium]